MIRGDEGEGAGADGIVLGTKDRGSRGFQTPLAKARVGLESRWLARVWVGLMVRFADIVGWLDG
jgi:hypothetical protein